jgi:hypothetical protein
VSAQTLDDVFGEVLPDATRDEVDDESSRRGGTRRSGPRDRRPLSSRDEELLRDVPPHHG